MKIGMKMLHGEKESRGAISLFAYCALFSKKCTLVPVQSSSVVADVHTDHILAQIDDGFITAAALAAQEAFIQQLLDRRHIVFRIVLLLLRLPAAGQMSAAYRRKALSENPKYLPPSDFGYEKTTVQNPGEVSVLFHFLQYSICI